MGRRAAIASEGTTAIASIVRTSAAVASAVVAAALLAASCAAPIRANSMLAPDANLPSRATYAWGAQPGGELGASVIGQYVQSAVSQQLAAKGYRLAASGSPGFVVDYRMVARPEASLEGFGGWGGGIQTIHYTKGMLIVSATDPATNQALWQAYASTIIDPTAPQADATARVDEAVAKMFQSFPAR
jgi:hypothetical protein